MHLIAIATASLTLLSTLAGGTTALRWPHRVPALMALAGGVVLAAAFCDLLPDALNRAEDLQLSTQLPLALTLCGYLAFYGLERFVHDRDHAAHGDGPNAAGLVGATGFVIHSLFDGLAIGLGFRISSAMGFVVAAAVIGHDFSDGLNTVSYLVAHHQPRHRAWRWLLADAVTPVIGAAIASFTPVPDSVFPVGLGFFSGLFIYAATTSLLPNTKGLALHWSLALTCTGASFMFAVSRLA